MWKSTWKRYLTSILTKADKKWFVWLYTVEVLYITSMEIFARLLFRMIGSDLQHVSCYIVCAREHCLSLWQKQAILAALVWEVVYTNIRIFRWTVCGTTDVIYTHRLQSKVVYVLIFFTLLQGYLVVFEEPLIKTVGETSNISAYI